MTKEYIELNILVDNDDKAVRIDMYHHKSEEQQFDNLIKSYKTLGGARRGAKKYGLKIVENEEQY